MCTSARERALLNSYPKIGNKVLDLYKISDESGYTQIFFSITNDECPYPVCQPDPIQSLYEITYI